MYYIANYRSAELRTYSILGFYIILDCVQKDMFNKRRCRLDKVDHYRLQVLRLKNNFLNIKSFAAKIQLADQSKSFAAKIQLADQFAEGTASLVVRGYISAKVQFAEICSQINFREWVVLGKSFPRIRGKFLYHIRGNGIFRERSDWSKFLFADSRVAEIMYHNFYTVLLHTSTLTKLYSIIEKPFKML